MLPIKVQNFLEAISIPIINFNFIDIAILIIIFIYALEGYAVGFIRATLDFTSFVISFFFALSFYGFFSSILFEYLNIPLGFSNVVGFFIAALISEILLTILFRSSLLPFISKRTKGLNIPDKVGRVAGIVPGVLSALVLLAFVLTMIVALPISPYLKNAVTHSKLGSPLVLGIQGFDDQINNVFGGAVNDALTFLTIEPKSNESLLLNFSTDSYVVDDIAESEMHELLNKERDKVGESELIEDDQLREVARIHCSDMLSNGYFSHYSLSGQSPFDRLTNVNIDFNAAGENLALAPSTILAMKGLMNSPGHKENIVSDKFNKIGIGVIDAGVYGKMFCQVFTD